MWQNCQVISLNIAVAWGIGREKKVGKHSKITLEAAARCSQLNRDTEKFGIVPYTLIIGHKHLRNQG